LNLLGYIDKGYEPSESDYALPDGRVVGPFESAHARDLFSRWFDKTGSRLVTAKDLYEGTVQGDEYRLIFADEVSLEMHPFAEICDIWSDDDNGGVVLEMEKGFAAVDPRRLVLIDYPTPSERRTTLSTHLQVPKVFDLVGPASVERVIKARQDGEIVVVNTGQHTGADFFVAWRVDGRVKRDLVGLSRHSHERVALKEAATFARDFFPPYKPRKNRPRDEQRERLYLWEHSFKSNFEEFEDLWQAQELADEICGDLRIANVSVKAGRKNLEHSHYSKGGIVTLASDMVDNHTVVHEVAHHVVARMKGVKEPSHGPIFAGVFLALLVRYMGVREDEALSNAVDRGIVVDRDVMKFVRTRLEPEAGSNLKI
jgi:hypothetical protein